MNSTLFEEPDTQPEDLITEDGEQYGFAADFVPVTEDDIERLLARQAALIAEAQRVTQRAARMADACTKQRQWITDHYGAMMEAYAKGAISRQGGKKKSVALLNGTLGYRTKAANIVIPAETEADALAWAQENYTQAVKVTTSLSRSAIKEILEGTPGGVVDKQTGELLTWARVEPAENVFYIKAGE